MSDLVTRCPACSTSFRITPGQIQKARGAVRCGSCLHIFNAQQHLVDASGQPLVEKPQAAAKRKPAQPSLKPKPKPPEQTSLAIPDAPVSEPSAHREPSAHKEPSAPRSESPAPKPQAPVIKPKAPRVKPETPAPSAPALKPATPQTSAAPTAEKSLQFDQAQIDRETADDDDLLISDDSLKSVALEDNPLAHTETSHTGVSLFDRRLNQERPEFKDDSDESWAEDLLEENLTPDTAAPERSPLSVTAEPPEENTSLPKQTSAPKTAAADSETPEHKEETVSQAPAQRFEIRGSRDDDEQGEHSTPYEPLKAYDRERSALIMNIDPEPVEFTLSSQRNWRRISLWGGLSLLALLLLAVQVAWLQFDRLSRQEPYRNYYQSACNLLGCELPQRVNRAQLRTYNLVVRDHPEVTNTLRVDAILLNTASFAQPFPSLLLSFSDLDDQPVASRVFIPAEYLRGELVGMELIPSNQPVHLSLDISDPGTHAVNYRLQIP